MNTKNKKAIIEEARASILYARNVREAHRRKTQRGSQQRETDIEVALKRLKRSMKPLRSIMGGRPYHKHSESFVAAVKSLSKEIQRERQKLWKMKQK